MLPPSISRALVITVAMVASLGHSARAGFVPPQTASTQMMLTNFNTTLSLSPFNTSLGTLESVVLTLNDQANFQGTLTNNSASAKSFDITENVAFAVSLGGQQLISNNVQQALTNTMLGVNKAVTFGPSSPTNSSQTTILDSGTLALFTGSNPLQFDFGAVGGVQVAGSGGNISFAFRTMGESSLTVSYFSIANNVVPEPASLAMLSLGGLIAAVGCRARSRARSAK